MLPGRARNVAAPGGGPRGGWRLDLTEGRIRPVRAGAGLAVGEEVFAAAGCTLLAPSRPGYGRTPLSTGGSVAGYTDVVRALCAALGITRVAAVVGVSGGGPTAATMAARHADLVERLLLVSAVGWLPYPDRRTRLGAHVVFAAGTEAVTWAGIHALARLAPGVCLRLMLRSLSTRPVGEVVAALRAEDRDRLLALFARMRSGRGFLNDLRPTPDVTARIAQPTLVALAYSVPGMWMLLANSGGPWGTEERRGIGRSRGSAAGTVAHSRPATGGAPPQPGR